VGTVIGALGAARRLRPDLRLVRGAAVLFGVGCAAAAVSPDEVLFGAALVLAGMAALTVTTATNSLVQLGTEPAMRGRVMAIRLAVALGGTPLGAPIVGWIAKNEGPRWALAVGAAAGLIAAALPRKN
jgi:MFS family permease